VIGSDFDLHPTRRGPIHGRGHPRGW